MAKTKKNQKNKFNKRDKDKEFDYKTEKPSGCKDNDPRWYATDPNLVADFAKLSFSNAVGYLNDIRPATGVDPYVEYSQGLHGKCAVPGLMTLELVPTIGEATDNNSAVNKGAMDLITQIRSKLGSFTKIYDAPDVMKYILAVDSAQTFYYFMCRLYGIMNLYYNDNRYYPETLIEANNVDFNSIVGQNANAFKGYIDKYANYVSKFPIPATLSLLARHAWLYQSIYTDADTLKPQLYMFVPGQFLKYIEVSGDTKCLQYMDFGPSYHAKFNLNDLITFGNDLLNAIQNSQDLQFIAGDIRKAFGDENMVPIYQIDNNYVVPQTTSYEVLSQIENSTAVGKNLVQFIAENYDVVDPTRALSLYYVGSTYKGTTLASNRITVATDVPTVASDKFINFHTKEAPSGDEVMVATRLTALARQNQMVANTTGTEDYIGILTCGSEFVTAYRIYRVGWDGVVYSYKFNTNNVSDTNDAFSASMWNAFDWSPELRFLNLISGSTDTYAFNNLNMEFANYTVLPASKVEQIHSVALMSEFGITQTTANKASFSTDKYTDR